MRGRRGLVAGSTVAFERFSAMPGTIIADEHVDMAESRRHTLGTTKLYFYVGSGAVRDRL